MADGCGGEAEEESRDGYGENGGAAARAVAGERPLIMFPMSTQREQRAWRGREQRKERRDTLGELTRRVTRSLRGGKMEGQLHA